MYIISCYMFGIKESVCNYDTATFSLKEYNN